MEQQLKALIERTLNATHPLAEAGAVADTKFLAVLLGIYRVSFTTLRDINRLASGDDAGPNILGLTRRMIEHGISIEYMILKGKEEMATRFQDYITVQMHEELELLKSVGFNSSTLSAELQINVAETEKAFAALPSGTKKDRSWAGINFEGMLSAVAGAGVIPAEDSPRFLSAYVWGCRANHPNPLMTHTYLDISESKALEIFSTQLGLVMALAVHLKLTTRLIDAAREAVGSNVYEEMANSIASIQSDLASVKVK